MRQENLDVRCDEWALASLTYEMLAGENRFWRPISERAEVAIEDAELVLPSLCWDELDPSVDDVIFFALDPDREERYATVADFAEELEPFRRRSKRGVRELSVIVGHADDEEEEEAEAAPPFRMCRSAGASAYNAHGGGACGGRAWQRRSRSWHSRTCRRPAASPTRCSGGCSRS
ncbi:MAG: hypothetical protein ACLSVD_08695 [Eggerthellaceae bacterium]